MAYKTLLKTYYKDKAEYEELYEKRINSENTKFLDVKIHSNQAFYCLCPDIHELTCQIMELDKKVQVLKKGLPPDALIQFKNKCLVDEIQLTNDIEGVYSTRKEIKIIVDEANEKHKKGKRRFQGLVNRYLMLADDKIELNNCEDIRKIYDELVLPEIIEDDPEKAPDGEIFRRDMAEVATATQKVIHKGVYPEEKIIDYMESSLKMLKDDSIPDLVSISIFHYLFGYIHPFYDGNGRTSRFISSYLLSRYFDILISYRLSYTIKENITTYYESFKICNDERNKGDVTPFIISFLTIIHKAFEKLYEALYDRRMLLEKTVNKLKDLEFLRKEEMINICVCLVLTSLFSKDGIGKKELSKVLEISETTLRKRLSVLKEHDLLIEKMAGQFKHYAIDIDKLNSDM